MALARDTVLVVESSRRGLKTPPTVTVTISVCVARYPFATPPEREGVCSVPWLKVVMCRAKDNNSRELFALVNITIDF